MNTPLPSNRTLASPARRIVFRTRGVRHGPITRLMSPGDLGQLVKPFVFLDLFEAERFAGRGFAAHPHSGIATLTTLLEGSMTYADSTGKSGSLSAGSVEWMRAGAGVWHTGAPAASRGMRGYQLWLALPEALELAPAESQYLEPHCIASVGPARVLLGHYNGVRSVIGLPVSITYLHVRLGAGQHWTYQPDFNHNVAWLAVNQGKVWTGDGELEREIAVFAPGNGAIEILAEGAVEFVMGSATQSSHPLVTGYYSVHTSQLALEQGERNISKMQHTAAVAALHPNR